MNDGHHVSPSDNATTQVGDDEIIVNLVQGLNPEFERVLSKATRATIGIDLKGHDEDTRDWEEMLQGGLQTALETQVVVFEVSGVSRACTHQLVRSRRAAFHQQSMRASYYGTQPEFRIPESIWNLPDEVKALWVEGIEATHKAYVAACEADASYQDARYILPEGTTNYIMLEYPLREFINVYAYRGCAMFQWEIVSVMRMCRELLVRSYPFLDPYIKISCEKTKGALDDERGLQGDAYAHHCTFQGWEEVEGQCPFPWARESNRAFKSEHHSIKQREPDEFKIVEEWSIKDKWWTDSPVNMEYRVLESADGTEVTQRRVEGGQWEDRELAETTRTEEQS
jgi:thymidylate synthase (FAD)